MFGTSEGKSQIKRWVWEITKKNLQLSLTVQKKVHVFYHTEGDENGLSLRPISAFWKC